MSNSKKKVGILTQPLHDNYGGLLQAYALQKVLNDKELEVWFIDRKQDNPGIFKNVFSYLKKEYLQKIYSKFPVYVPSMQQKEIISKDTLYFKNKYFLNITSPVDSEEKLKSVGATFDIIIVGSDQVWRPMYSVNIYNYFLDFVKGNKKIKKIAYAASFGVDNWEFSDNQTKKCATLAKEFNAISVREDSGVELCNQHLGVRALHVLDPTLLVGKEHYINLFQAEKEAKNEWNLMTYILDLTEEKKEVIKNIETKKNLEAFSLTRKEKLNFHTAKNIKNCVYPSVTSWIRGFYDAEFIITDSFHGTVFSILFNKPFIVFANARRGSSRFSSLLKTFGLEKRIIFDYKDFDYSILEDQIDWDNVNDILEKERSKSFKFLTDNI